MWEERLLPDLACVFFISFVFLTISEPLLFRSLIPAKNFTLVALGLIGLSRLLAMLRVSRPMQTATAFFIVALTALAVQHANIADAFDRTGRSAQGFAFAVLLYSGLCFSAGGAMPLIIRSRIVVPLAVITALTTLFLFVSNSEDLRIWWGGVVYADGSHPNHLSVDEAVVSLFFLTFAVLRSRLRYALALGLLICLFLSGSRASTLMAAAAFIGAEVLTRRNLKQWVYAFFGAMLLGLIVALNSGGVAFVLEALFPRGLVGDESYQAREIIMSEGRNSLLDQFWFGDAALLVQRLGSVGAYIHNLLSAWQFYGFPAFACLVAALVVAAVRAVRFDYRLGQRRHVFGLLLLLYAAVGAVTAKYVGAHSLWFALGFWGAVTLPSVMALGSRPSLVRRTG